MHSMQMSGTPPVVTPRHIIKRETCENITKIVGGVMLETGLRTACGAVAGATGAAIMDAVGDPGYPIGWSAAAGALGGALTGVSIVAARYGRAVLPPTRPFAPALPVDSATASQFLWNCIGATSVGNLIGGVILSGADVPGAMGCAQASTAGTIGAAVICGGLACLIELGSLWDHWIAPEKVAHAPHAPPPAPPHADVEMAAHEMAGPCAAPPPPQPLPRRLSYEGGVPHSPRPWGTPRSSMAAGYPANFAPAPPCFDYAIAYPERSCAVVPGEAPGPRLNLPAHF